MSRYYIWARSRPETDSVLIDSTRMLIGSSYRYCEPMSDTAMMAHRGINRIRRIYYAKWEQNDIR